MKAWIYDEIALNGGAGGEVFRAVFNGSGFDAAELLAREAIQNSVDAARPGQKPEVTIATRLLEGAEFEAFWTSAGLDHLAKRVDRLELPAGNVLSEKPLSLRVLYIEDRGTTGLEGDPTLHTSKLRKLLMEIGGSRKVVEGPNSGGSYGFGKAVYAGSSRIATIFAYSRTTDAKGEPLSVLMGCAYHVAHEYDGKETTGRGFYGKSHQVEGRGPRYDPFIGAEADELAEKLGMEREEGNLGTTIAIVDCELKAEEIKTGIESSWWPRILKEGFRVEVRDETNKKHVPQPKKNPRIFPAYWEAMELATAKTLVDAGRTKLVPVSNGEGKALGKLGLVVMKNVTPEDLDDDETSDQRNTIAMVRSTGMVVWHHNRRGNSFPPIAGVFVADESPEIDAILRRAEPPEHNLWDEKASRLATDVERKLVKAIKDNCWRNLKDFQKKVQPPKPQTGGQVSELEKMLGKIFGPSGQKPPGGEGKEATPISLRSTVAARPEADGLVAAGQVELALAKKAQPTTVRLRVELRVLDEQGHMKDEIPLKLKSGPTLSPNGEALVGDFELDETDRLTFDLESEVYDKEWTVTFVPTVTPLTKEEVE
jgi:hypothetical protein